MYRPELKYFRSLFGCLIFGLFSLMSMAFYPAHLPVNGPDIEPPVITQAALDSSVLCNEDFTSALNTWYNNAGGALATDNSGIVSFIGVPDILTTQALLEASTDTLCGENRHVEVGFVAIDTCGNTSVDTSFADFFVIDNTNPILIQPATNVVENCVTGINDTLRTWIDNFGGSIIEDNCTEDLIWNFIWNDTSGNSGAGTIGTGPYFQVDRSKCEWSVNVAFIAINPCGLSTATAGSFSIIDTEAPMFSYLPQDTMVHCDQLPPNDLIAIDGCDGNLVIEYFESSSQSSDSTSCEYSNYSLLREWIVFDECGNNISHSQNIEVIDTIAPTFELPFNSQVICSNLDSLEIAGNISNIIETCSEVIVTYSDTLDGFFCPFQVLRTWKVTDACGNFSTGVQILDVIDNLEPEIIEPAQDRFIHCDSLINAGIDFAQWVNRNGDAIVIDQCASLSSFAAVPGSYNPADTTSFPGMPVGDLDAQVCPSLTTTYLRSETVDFVFYDRCGNVAVTQATYAIIDTIAPMILDCPSDTIINTIVGECFGTISPQLSALSDNCGQLEPTITQTITQQISSTDPGSNQVIVDSLSFSFGPVNLLNTNANGNIVLTIEINNLDIDDNDEFFIIKAEDGTIIDSTDIGNMQCDDLTVIIDNITNEQINEWAADGFITIWLVPNLDVDQPVFSINDVCGGSSASITLTYDIDLVSSLFYTLQIDGSTPVDIDINSEINLDAGIHELTYIASDCAGNTNACIQMVTIIDNEAPMVECPGDVTLYVTDTECELMFDLIDSLAYTDNCGGDIIYHQTRPLDPINSGIVFNLNPATGLYVAANKLFSFSDVSKIKYSTQDPKLRVVLTGDINDPGEYFFVLGENGEMLGSTTVSTESTCGVTTITDIDIPIGLFNQFAENGTVEITLVSNVSDNIDGGGINSCIPLSPGVSMDGISNVSIDLSYSDVMVNYYIEGATTESDSPLEAGFITLNAGENEIFYIAQDLAGNADTCSYLVSILDTIAPVINCTNAVVFVDPSGLVDYILDLDEITSSITDNCSITDTIIDPPSFTCADVGEEFTVTITVSDAQGNTGSCSSQVRVEMPILSPSFSSGVCEDDTLSLFANVPEPPIANAYTFSWSGPNGFISGLENPFILNPDASYSGTYILEVEGFGSCVSMGTVEVSVDQLVTPQIQSTTPEVCIGDEVLLTTTSFTGDLEYQWYEGVFPNGILMQTTQNASYLVSPAVGEHFYYVIVESAGCVTNASPSFQVDVLDPPVATVNTPFITICEGEEIILGTDNFNPLFEYFWSGPDNYSAEGQYPPVIPSADLNNQGTYSLVIKFGSCISDTATTQVVLFDKPVRPTITGEEIYCEGNTIILSVNNVANADQYNWFLDGVLYTVTSTNSLVINGAESSQSGDWTVVIRDGICESDPSAIKPVSVENQFQISASNNGPGCQGDSVQLNVAFIPNATYLWTTPSGQTLTEQNPLVPSIAGEYTVTMTTASGCETAASTTVAVLSVPVITALSNSSLDCTDGTAVVNFEPTIVPAGNYTYNWTGPISLDAVENPQITNANISANGVYTLTVLNGNCESEPLNTIINFNLTPEQAMFSTYDDSVCEGSDYFITAMNLYPSGLQYFWETPIGNIQTSDASLNIISTNQNDNGFYILTVINQGCPAPVSDTLFLSVEDIPVAPVITSTGIVCEGDALSLSTNVQNADIYQWTGPNGYISDQQNPIIPDATELNSGIYQLTVLNNGCPSPASEEFMIEVLAIPPVPMIEFDNYQMCKSQSDQIQICVDPTSIVSGASYELYIDDNFIITSTNGCYLINSQDNFITPGVHTIKIVTKINNCRSAFSLAAILVVDEAPQDFIQIDDAMNSFCDVDIVELDIQAGATAGITWAWSSTDEDIIFQNPTGLSTTATGMSLGDNPVIVTSSFGSCTEYASDTINIELVPGAIANDDLFTLDYNQSSFLDILDNDEPNGSFILSIFEQPEFGSVSLINNLIQYTADPNFSDSQTFAYELCNIRCVDNCEVAFVTIEINQNFDCVVPTIITPNNDGINDKFVIPCFNTGQYQNNQVKIFNQWGDEVFGAQPYENNWSGTYLGEQLPVGTYFYIVDIGDDSKPLNGFLMIQR